jgi:hypothetical protein
MLAKHKPIMNTIYEHIRKNITIGKKDVDQIATDVIERYSPEIIYPHVDNETLHNFIRSLVCYAYYLYHNIPYDKM